MSAIHPPHSVSTGCSPPHAPCAPCAPRCDPPPPKTIQALVRRVIDAFSVQRQGCCELEHCPEHPTLRLCGWQCIGAPEICNLTFHDAGGLPRGTGCCIQAEVRQCVQLTFEQCGRSFCRNAWFCVPVQGALREACKDIGEYVASFKLHNVCLRCDCCKPAIDFSCRVTIYGLCQMLIALPCNLPPAPPDCAPFFDLPLFPQYR